MKVTTEVTTRTTTRMVISDDLEYPVEVATIDRELVRRRITYKISMIRLVRRLSHNIGLRGAKEFADMLELTHDYWWPPDKEDTDEA